MMFSLEKLYKSVGTVKQNVHGYLDRYQARKSMEQQVLKVVVKVRKEHPDMGLREIYFKVQPDYIGRDTFELLCKNEGLSLMRLKNFHRTTDSSGTRFFPNYVEGTVIDRRNQIWQSDITYYPIKDKLYYITMIQDAFSKVIVGHHASKGLSTENTTLPALMMALKNRKHQGLEGLVFHSDGGGQYYDKEFLRITRSEHIINSMGKSCYENAMAESLNGVIKNKYLRYRNIKSLKDLHRELDRTVQLYNTDKPHSALQRMTPEEYERKCITSHSQTKAGMTESINAKVQMDRASGPDHLSQTKDKEKDVIYAN